MPTRKPRMYVPTPELERFVAEEPSLTVIAAQARLFGAALRLLDKEEKVVRAYRRSKRGS